MKNEEDKCPSVFASSNDQRRFLYALVYFSTPAFKSPNICRSIKAIVLIDYEYVNDLWTDFFIPFFPFFSFPYYFPFHPPRREPNKNGLVKTAKGEHSRY